MRPARLTLSLAAFGLVACHRHGHGHDGDGSNGIVVFREAEVNDEPASANHFGLLRPGQRFFIDGFVRDDAFDPFDGFAFTAREPLHVDFELFIDAPGADLDVSLYDPQLDATVAAWTSTDNPEVGGVDVFAGGLDFHLVIESFAGDTSYSLAITVGPLFGREALRAAGAPDVVGVGARDERRAKAADAYGEPKRAPRRVIERVLEIDPARGLVLERRRVLGL
jgi:hypothetical protein